MKTIYMALLGVMISTGVLSGNEVQIEEKKHIEVGCRAMSHIDRVQIQEERAKRTEENKEQETSVADKKMAIDFPVAAKTYYTSHPGAFHNPICVSVYGDAVELEDGSVWSVSAKDCYKTLDWMTSDAILITQNTAWFSVYHYKLINLNTGAKVHVNLSLGPIYNGIYTHFITAINYIHREVYLEDGSIWQISFWDNSIMDQWLPNDTIILGVNDDWLTQGKSPNILINVNTNEYVAAYCIN